MNAREYYLSLQNAIHESPHVLSSDIHFEEIDVNECYVRGVINLIANLELHIAEYTRTTPTVVHLKYRYHLQTSAGKLISRWDNAQHHTAVATFPYHRHDQDDHIHPSPPVSIPDVLDASLPFI